MLSTNDIEKVNVFKDTYNALYLKGLSIQKLDYVKSTSNSVQKRLIDNLIRYPNFTKNIEYIEGPIGVRKYKLELNGKPKKSIYLFGELHKKTTGQCIPKPSIDFAQYLKLLSKESPAFVDVYVEMSIVKTTIKKTKSFIVFSKSVKSMFKNRIKFPTAYMKHNNPTDTPKTTGFIFDKIKKEFKDCIQPETRSNNADCELIRIHFVDIRSTYDITLTNSINEICSLYTEDVGLIMLRTIFKIGIKLGKTSAEIIDVVRRINKHCPSILNMLKMLIKNEDINLLDIFNKGKIFKKELDASYKKEDIISFLKVMSIKKVGFAKQDFIEDVKNLISSIENKTEVTIDFINRIIPMFMHLNNLLLDCYCLSRIFKLHNVKPGSFQPVESKNIIVYAGNNHIRNMAEFLGFLNYKPTFNFHNKDERSCVNIKRSNTYIIQKSPTLYAQLKSLSPRVDQDKTIKELILISKNLNCKGYSKLKKHDLITLINKCKKQSPNDPKKLTLVQLKNVAKKMNLKGYSKLRKEKLIGLINANM